MELTRRQFGTTALATVGSAVALVALPAIEGCTEPSWVKTAISDLPEVIGIINSILSVVALAGPLLPPGIGIAAQLVEAGLTAIDDLLQNYQVAPNASLITQIDAWLTDVQKNLSAILAAGRIENAATQALIATGVTLAILVIQGIQALIPASATASPVSLLAPTVLRREIKVKMNVPVALMTPAQLKANYNLIAVAAGYAQQQVP